MNIIYSDDINSDDVTDKKLALAKELHINNCKRQVNRKAFRVYVVNNTDYTAKGYCIDSGKRYKDKIRFIYTSDYKAAKKAADKLLNDTSELCIAIESLLMNRLSIIYKDKIKVLKVKYSYKTSDKRQAIHHVKRLTELNGGATVEIKSGQYIVSSYK